MKVSEDTKVSTDLKTILSIVAGVAVGVWAYFGLHESLNATKTKVELMSKDLEENTCLLYTSPSPRDRQKSRMPSSA